MRVPSEAFPMPVYLIAVFAHVLLGIVLAGSAGGIVAANGWEATYDSDALRLTFTFLVLGTLVLLLVMVLKGAGPLSLDRLLFKNTAG